MKISLGITKRAPKEVKSILKKILSIINYIFLIFKFPRAGVCFVSGSPRSGTSAMIDWLSESHQIAAFSEPRLEKGLSQFMDFIDCHNTLQRNKSLLLFLIKRLFYGFYGSQKYIWNKKIIAIKEPMLPNDERLIGNLKVLFPNIKVLYMIRHPVFVLSSMRNRLWGHTVNKGVNLSEMTIERGLSIWKFNVNQLIKLMNDNSSHQWLYVCRYENLVENSESESRKIQEFLKLRKLPDFLVKKSSTVNLEPNVIERILHETKEERQFLNYSS